MKNRIRRWNKWRKRSINSKIYKLCVLLGIIHSPTFELCFPREWGEWR